MSSENDREEIVIAEPTENERFVSTYLREEPPPKLVAVGEKQVDDGDK